MKGDVVGWRRSEVATSVVGFGLRRKRGGGVGERDFNRHRHVGPVVKKNIVFVVWPISKRQYVRTVISSTVG